MHLAAFFGISLLPYISSLGLASETMMHACSKLIMLPRSVGLTNRLAVPIASANIACGFSTRFAPAFITTRNGPPRSIHHRNIVTSLPIHASTADVQGSKPSIDASIITEGLNPSQEEATLRPRYSITRVIAGPGAGKTKVLTCRIAHLLLDSETNTDNVNGYSRPEGILAVTFTKKAAMEMERRLGDLLASSTRMMYDLDEASNVAGDTDAIVVNGNADTTDDDGSNEISRQLMRQTTVGTFHSVCSKILRKFGDELGNLPSVRECTAATPILNAKESTNGVLLQTLDGSFNILDQNDQLRILKDVLKEHNIVLKSNDAMSRGGGKDEIRPITVLNAISLLNTEDAVLRTPQKNARKDTISEETAEKMSKKVRNIAEEIRIPFQKAKYAQNSVDFDDLIFLTRELLLFHPEVREVLHRRWRHVLVDEFQDTSQIQLDLVRLLTTNSLFVVGDGDQSIYSWRGASPESMTDFEAAFHDKMHGWEGLFDHNSLDLNAYYQEIDRMRPNVDGHGSIPLEVKSVYLMENYRSTTNIVKAAQRIISSSEADSNDAQDDLRRDMKPMRGVGPSPRVLACKDAKSESNFVVKLVKEMVEKGELTPSSTVAMIYRTNAQSRLLEEACVEHNLRYVVRGSTGTFYKRAEIQDSLSFLKIMYNDRDRSAWARAVKAPSRGIGETSLNEFFRYCDSVTERYAQSKSNGSATPTPMDVLLSLVSPNGSHIHELASPTEFLSTRSINRFVPFASSLMLLKEKLKTQTVNEFLLSVIEDLNLKSHFDSISKTRDEYEDRLGNVMELVRAADRYKEDGPCLCSSDDDESPIERFLDDVALIADIEPDSSENSDDRRIVANLMTIHSSKGMEFDAVFLVGNEEGTFPTQKAIGQGEGSIELSEERRLCYVAMTRAKTHLILTWRKEVSYFAGNSFKTKDADRSRFLNVLVSKPDNKGKQQVSNMKTSASRQVKKSRTGTRMVHTEASRGDDVQSREQSWDKWQPAGQQRPAASRTTDQRSSTVNTRTIREKQFKSSPQKERRNWDNWEPSHLRNPIQQVPSIKLKTERTQQAKAITARQYGSASGNLRRDAAERSSPISANKRPYRNTANQNQSIRQQSRSANTPTQQSKVRIYTPPEIEKGDVPTDIDSTIFFPVGSSVKHKFYGRGKVHQPPISDEEFATKMLVRVQFEDEPGNLDLPMDSLMHTYE